MEFCFRGNSPDKLLAVSYKLPSTHPADAEFPVHFGTLNEILRHTLSSDQLFTGIENQTSFFPFSFA